MYVYLVYRPSYHKPEMVDVTISGASGTLRTIHMTFAYWGFVLMSFHLGLHIRAVCSKYKIEGKDGKDYGKDTDSGKRASGRACTEVCGVKRRYPFWGGLVAIKGAFSERPQHDHHSGIIFGRIISLAESTFAAGKGTWRNKGGGCGNRDSAGLLLWMAKGVEQILLLLP